LSRNYGFITSPDELQAVINVNRLRPVLVRCGNGRFTCPAQNVQHMVDIVNKSNLDYIRDISIFD
jgi:hypothetical protein